jgi:hypothetical protein
MALILIRGESNSKLLNAISDMERHGSLNIISKPKVIDSNFADSLVENILNSKLRTKSNVATAFFVKEDTTLSIMQIKKMTAFIAVIFLILRQTTNLRMMDMASMCVLS